MANAPEKKLRKNRRPTTKNNRRKGLAAKKKNEEEHKHMREKLHARFGGSKRQNDVLIASINPTTMEITHPTSYERQMSRALEAHLHRLIRPETPEDLMPSVWLCSLCQNRSCFDSLGDLYGPYFMEIGKEIQPPKAFVISPILKENLAKEEAPAKRIGNRMKTTNKLTTQQHSPLNKCTMDLWFHGKCALWAPELFLIGGKFLGLEKFLKKYWSQKCKICSKIGATINIQNKYFIHFPCAKEKGYRFKELTFTCLEPLETPIN